MTQAANVAASTPPSWTTATRPASPAAGQQGWNTTLLVLEVWNGVAWQAVSGQTYTANYLVVAGGGGGGYSNGAGGGAGGLLTSSTFALSSGVAYAITIGSGGTGGYSGGAATAGTNSSIASLVISIGGGLGSTSTVGGNGGVGAFYYAGSGVDQIMSASSGAFPGGGGGGSYDYGRNTSGNGGDGQVVITYAT